MDKYDKKKKGMREAEQKREDLRGKVFFLGIWANSKKIFGNKDIIDSSIRETQTSFRWVSS